MGTKETKVIAFGTLKGGTGKTSVAFNCGGVLSETHKVLFIDVDPQSNLTDSVGVDTTIQDAHTVRDIFEDKSQATARPEILITKSPIEELPNLDIIASHIRLTETELRLVSASNRENILARWITKYAAELSIYDYILIDTNPSMGLINQNAFMVADSIVLVSNVSNKARQGAELFTYLWGEIRETFAKEDNVKALVLNNVDKRVGLSRQIREYYQDDEEFGGLLVKTDIPARKDLMDTETAYVPVNILKPQSDACTAFRSVVKELKDREVF